MLRRNSHKRQKEDREYTKVCREMDREAEANGTHRCFFCGGGFSSWDPAEHHHLRGRTGSLLTDKRFIIPGHHLCHTVKWHTYTIKELMKESWFEAFRDRLEEKDSQSYNKLINKIEDYG